MNIRSFVGISSALLLTWLGATYFHEIPPELYSKKDRTSAPTQKLPVDETMVDLSSNKH